MFKLIMLIRNVDPSGHGSVCCQFYPKGTNVLERKVEILVESFQNSNLRLADS